MKYQEEELIAHCQKALIIKYDNPRIHEKLAQIYQGQFKLQETTFHCIKSLKFDPGNLKNYWRLKYALLGLITWGNKKIDAELLQEGITIVRQTIQTQPKFPFAHVVLGILLTLQGKNDEAINSYQAASYQQLLLYHPQVIDKHWDSNQKLHPSFIIPGFMKCGTTSLYSYLINHPQVLPAVDKELCFFSNLFEQNLDYYLAHYPAISNNTNYITGEATPIYINYPIRAKQIFTLFPKMKFIILLRNPVDRSISSYYQQHQASGKYKLTQSNINETIERIPYLINKWFSHWPLLEASLLLEDSQQEYIDYFLNYVLLPDLLGSLYFYYLKEWMSIFPREQFLILKSEDLFENPSTTMKQVFKFLNLPDYQSPNYSKINSGSYRAIPEKLRHHLGEFFRPYNQQLEEYLNMKFNWE